MAGTQNVDSGGQENGEESVGEDAEGSGGLQGAQGELGQRGTLSWKSGSSNQFGPNLGTEWWQKQ